MAAGRAMRSAGSESPRVLMQMRLPHLMQDLHHRGFDAPVCDRAVYAAPNDGGYNGGAGHQALKCVQDVHRLAAEVELRPDVRT
jgi:hypothetical protein